MKIKKINSIEIIYLSFALDSLLKINFAEINIHFGIFLILIYILFLAFIKIDTKIIASFLTNNYSIIPFIIYYFLNYIINTKYPGSTILIINFTTYICVFLFFYKYETHIKNTTIKLFQWILILSGLFQFSLFIFFDYQLSFYDSSHYLADASFAYRMRGFFIEPNWFSIILTLNSLLLISTYQKNILKFKLLIILSILCMALNNTYLPIIALFAVLIFEQAISIHKISKIKTYFIFLAIVFSFILIVFRTNYFSSTQNNKSNIDISSFVNYSSRLYPMLKTLDYMASQDVDKIIFGFGLGSWPYIGVRDNALGYIGFFQSDYIEDDRRDSSEIHVLYLEMGILSLFLVFFDYLLNFFKSRKENLIYAIACFYLVTCFFTYPILKFLIYTTPFYILRSRSVKKNYVKNSK